MTFSQGNCTPASLALCALEAVLGEKAGPGVRERVTVPSEAPGLQEGCHCICVLKVLCL